MGVAPSVQARLSDDLGLSWRPTARRFDLVRELSRGTQAGESPPFRSGKGLTSPGVELFDHPAVRFPGDGIEGG